MAREVLTHPGIHPSSLSDRLGRGRPSVSKDLRLREDGLVRDEPDPLGRRYYPTRPMRDLFGRRRHDEAGPL